MENLITQIFDTKQLDEFIQISKAACSDLEKCFTTHPEFFPADVVQGINEVVVKMMGKKQNSILEALLKQTNHQVQ